MALVLAQGYHFAARAGGPSGDDEGVGRGGPGVKLEAHAGEHPGEPVGDQVLETDSKLVGVVGGTLL